MTKAFIALLVASFTAGCGGAILDPTGNWSLKMTPGAGDCDLEADDVVITVTESTDGYLLSGSDPSVTVTGTVTCTDETCKLSVVEVGTLENDGVTITMSVSYNLTVDAANKITGSGSASATADNDFSCSQAFTATGSKS